MNERRNAYAMGAVPMISLSHVAGKAVTDEI